MNAASPNKPLLGLSVYLLFFWTVLLGLPPVAAGAEKQVTEYQVKAVFLYNLAKFVTWPEDRQVNRGEFLIGIYGTNPFGSIIHATVENEKLHNKPIKVVQYSTVSELQDTPCNILFISSSAMEQFETIRKNINNLPILTVSDTRGFPEQGGMVNLRKESQKIEVEINREATSTAGLFISSKLLRLARIVK